MSNTPLITNPVVVTPPRRQRSVTIAVRPGTERSMLNAIGAQHGLAPTFTWRQRSTPLLIPMPEQ